MGTYIMATFLIGFLVGYFYFIFSKKTPLLIKYYLLFGAFYMSLFPFLLSKKVNAFLGEGYFYYANTLNTFFVSCVILFMFLCIARLIRFKCYKFLAAISIIISLSALYEGLKTPNIKEVNIATNKVSKDYKIVFLSDIHITKNLRLEKIKNIVKKVNATNPDAIILGGDIIDDSPDANKPFLKELAKLKAKDGVFYSLGNHEVYRGLSSSLGQIYQNGFNYLFNSGNDLGEVFVAGIPDMTAQKDKVYLKGAFADSIQNEFRVLSSHSPYNFGNANNFDLMLSGHTHGGQIFPFHILAKLKNKYLAGLYDMGNGVKIYVSRGAGQWGPQLRLFAPAEITLINITPQKPQNPEI